MSNISDIFNGLIDVLIILLPVLLAVAFMTLIERKILSAMQRRCGPNVVGYYGTLNPSQKLFKKYLFLFLVNLCILDFLIIYFIIFLILFLVYLVVLIILWFCCLYVIILSLKFQCPHDCYIFPFVISNNNGTNDIYPTIELLSSMMFLYNGKPQIFLARRFPFPFYIPYSPISTAANKSNKTVETNSNDNKVEILNEAINKLEQIAKSKRGELKPLNATILHTIHNVLDVNERKKLYEKLRNTGELLGGIYAIQYKNNPNIFYIGRAFEFSSRLASHIRNSLEYEQLFTTNLFYNFVKDAGGWENFTFHILEFLPKNIPLQIEKENFYFMKYNPILNTMTSGRYNPKKSLNKDKLSENKTNNKLEVKNKHSRRAKLLWIYKIDSNLLKRSSNNKNNKPELFFKFIDTCLTPPEPV